MVDHLHDGPHAWNMHGGPLMVAEAIRQLNFQRKCSSWTSCIKISPAAHVKRLCNGQKTFCFCFSFRGPGP